MRDTASDSLHVGTCGLTLVGTIATNKTLLTIGGVGRYSVFAIASVADAGAFQIPDLIEDRRDTGN